MRRAGGVVVCLFALSFASPGARADDPDNPGGLGVGVSIGTTGVGGELSVRPYGNLVLRAGGGWFALSHDFTSDDLTFGLQANLISIGATLDWHPFSNGFRLSGGGRYHKVDFSGAGNSPTGAFTINGHPYLMATTGPIHASVTSSSTVAPYLGLGYDSTHFSASHWALALELGVIYASKPTSKITAQRTGTTCAAGTEPSRIVPLASPPFPGKLRVAASGQLGVTAQVWMWRIV
jgi:hypothetical protein